MFAIVFLNAIILEQNQVSGRFTPATTTIRGNHYDITFNKWLITYILSYLDFFKYYHLVPTQSIGDIIRQFPSPPTGTPRAGGGGAAATGGGNAARPRPG